MKTGKSPFSVRHFTHSYDGNLFAPLAGLNQTRRQFLALAEETLAAACIPSPEHVNEAYRRWNDQKQAFAPGTSGLIRQSPTFSAAPLRVCGLHRNSSRGS